MDGIKHSIHLLARLFYYWFRVLNDALYFLFMAELGHYNKLQLNLYSGLAFAMTFITKPLFHLIGET